MLSIFSHAYWPYVFLIWINVCLGLLNPFLNGYFVAAVELYELCVYWEIKPLSVASFANILSHSVGCLFVLLIVSFAVQKLISLVRSHLFIFVSYCLWRLT